LWLDFNTSEPVAVKVSNEDNVNCLTGESDIPMLIKIKKSHAWPPKAQQNYMILPEQRWLGNMNVGGGEMAQFTASSLTDGDAAASQMSGEKPHSLTITTHPLLKDDAEVYATTKLCEAEAPIDLFMTPEDAGLRAGDTVYLRSRRLPGVRPATLADHGVGPHAVLQLEFVPDMTPPTPEVSVLTIEQMEGFSGGGNIDHKVYPDLNHGPEKWDIDVVAKATVHLVNSRVFVAASGRPMPVTSITETAYKKLGLPKAYQRAWDREPDTKGIYSEEVSEIASARDGMFQSRSCLVAYELRK